VAQMSHVSVPTFEPEDNILSIHYMTQINQNIVNCNQSVACFLPLAFHTVV